MVRKQLLLGSFILFILSLICFTGSAHAAVLSVKCTLQVQTAHVDVDGDKTLTHKVLASETSYRSNDAQVVEKYDRDLFYFHVAVHSGNEIRVFIRNKKNMTALSYNGTFSEKAEWLLSDSGAETDNGLLLNCAQVK